MKIRGVSANNKKKAFEVRTWKTTYDFPYALSDPSPEPGDAVDRVFVDAELGREGFTYELASGREGSVHVDSVLEYNRDPAYVADLALYRLTLEATRRVASSRLSKREIVRRLGTSASQFYRLLDPANYKKSLRQLVSLLAVLGYEVDIGVTLGTPARVCEPSPSGSPHAPTDLQILSSLVSLLGRALSGNLGKDLPAETRAVRLATELLGLDWNEVKPAITGRGRVVAPPDEGHSDWARAFTKSAESTLAGRQPRRR